MAMSTRRLPVFILVDTSGSMRGEPIQALNVGLKTMEQALRRDPFALESVHLSLITFDLEVRELFPLTPLDQVRIPEIEVPTSGATFLGAALKLLVARVDRDVQKGTSAQRGDWRPMAFIMTDGSPSDTQAFEEATAALKQRQFAHVVACAAGPKAKPDLLRKITDSVVALDTLNGAGFAQFFKWVSSSIASSGRSISLSDTLPDLPTEVRVAF